MPLVSEPQSFDATTDVKSSINPVNIGITGGVGFVQKVGKGELFLDLRGAYGLTKVQKDSQNGSSHNGYLLTALGYAISL
jgi:hypothetical protein